MISRRPTWFRGKVIATRVLLFWTLIASASTGAQQQRDTAARQERVVAVVPPGVEAKAIAFSSTGNHVVFGVLQDKGWSIVVDQRIEKIGATLIPNPGISPSFLPAGAKVVYQAWRNGESHLVVDGERGDSFDELGFFPSYSPDGASLACEGTIDRKRHVAVNGRVVSAQFEEAWSPLFLPDGKLVYCAKKDGRSFVVIDGMPQEPFDSIPELGFPVSNTEGTRVAYHAVEKSKQIIVVGKERYGHEFDYSEYPAFSPKTGRLAFFAMKAKKQFLVCDGVKGPDFDGVAGNTVRSPDARISMHPPVFSPDGKRVAYIARKEGRCFVVEGSSFGPGFDNIQYLAFSPDSSRLAYVATADRKSFVVIGDSRGERFDLILNAFSTPGDLRSLGFVGILPLYVAREAGKELVVCGDKKGETFDSMDSLTIAPDGKSFAYRARNGGRSYIVLGSEKGEAFDEVWLAPSGVRVETVNFGARKGNKLLWITAPTLR